MPSRAEKLLERMRRSLSGWGQDDFRTLYKGFGFDEKEGKKHRRYTHPVYPFLQATVGRHNALDKGYTEDAIELIDKLKKLTEEARMEEEASDAE